MASKAAGCGAWASRDASVLGRRLRPLFGCHRASSQAPGGRCPKAGWQMLHLDGSAGLWSPYALGSNPAAAVWGHGTRIDARWVSFPESHQIPADVATKPLQQVMSHASTHQSNPPATLNMTHSSSLPHVSSSVIRVAFPHPKLLRPVTA